MNNCFNGVCTKWTVGDAVREILVNNESVYDAVGENIYPIVAPEGTVDPFIVYYRDKYRRETSKMGIVEDECNVVITILSADYDEGANIAGLVDSVLFGKHTNDETGCTFDFELVDGTEGFEDNKYYQQMVYRIS